MSNTQLIPYFVVNAFTHEFLQGNPAAVCILTDAKSDSWLQQVAKDFNLSETAFLWHKRDNLWQLRWFTPSCEIKLCGHATLAAAHVLARELNIQSEEFHFSTLSGILQAKVNATAGALIFPRIEPKLFSNIYLHNPEVGIRQLQLNAVACYQAGEDIIIELASEAEVASYIPELDKIAKINTRGVIITAPSKNSARDFVSRFFAPRAGINEDPVTGSAHCSLAVLWGKKLNKSVLRAEQLSQRGGFIELAVGSERISLSGASVTFDKGQLA